MAPNFLSCDRDQASLMPPSISEWLPDEHLARFVVGVVERLDLDGIYAAYRADGNGRPAHDPQMMVSLLLYAYAVGVRSSREIERACVENVAFRFIAANRCPDHVTINRFRSRHCRALAGLFTDVLALCARAGMVNVATVAIDGTKLRANASLGQTRSEQGLRAEAERILGEAARIDAEEDELYGDARGDELPHELADPNTRAARISELLEGLRAEREAAEADHEERVRRYQAKVAESGRRPPGRPPKPELPPDKRRLLTTKVNVTDPDSRVVRDKGALVQGYNAQAAVGEGQVILAARIAADVNDSRQLEPLTVAADEELRAAGVKEPISSVLADGAYWNRAQMDRLKARGIETVVPTSGSRPSRRPPKRGPHAERIDRLLATPEGKARYRRRQQIVEPVFAQIKFLRGITRFQRRGKAAVEAEWRLIATTHNLLKLHRLSLTPSLG